MGSFIRCKDTGDLAIMCSCSKCTKDRGERDLLSEFKSKAYRDDQKKESLDEINFGN